MAGQKRKEDNGLFAQYGGQDTSSYGGLKFNFKSNLDQYGGPETSSYGGPEFNFKSNLSQYGGQDIGAYGGPKFNFKSDLSRYGGPDIGAYGGQGIAEYGNLPKPPEAGDETNGTVKRLLDKILKMKRGRL